MNNTNRSALVVVLMFWCATAYAQHVSKPSFGDELVAVSGQAWFFVGCFTLVGIVWRLLTDYRPDKPPVTWNSFLSVIVLGALAGFLAFWLCETWRWTWKMPMLDGVQGMVISVFARNNEKWLRRFSDAVESKASAIKSVLREKQP